MGAANSSPPKTVQIIDADHDKNNIEIEVGDSKLIDRFSGEVEKPQHIQSSLVDNNHLNGQSSLVDY